MSRGINTVILIGNLGVDPEVRALPSGDAVANLSLATSETWIDKTSGESRERTEWHRVVLFGRLADIAAQYLHLGSKVYIEGKLRTRQYQAQDGSSMAGHPARRSDQAHAKAVRVPLHRQPDPHHAQRHLHTGERVLYDLSSSYFEGASPFPPGREDPDRLKGHHDHRPRRGRRCLASAPNTWPPPSAPQTCSGPGFAASPARSSASMSMAAPPARRCWRTIPFWARA